MLRLVLLTTFCMMGGCPLLFVRHVKQRARGHSKFVLQDKQAEFAIPDVPVKLSLEHDSMLSFINELGGETN